MWCVVYAGEGREERTEDFIRTVLPASVYTRCFHLVQHKALKRQGILRDVVQDYLPGYVFIETQEPAAVQEILKETPGKLLFSDDWFVSTLTGEEESLLGLIADAKGEIGISVARTKVDAASGRKRNEYLSGPLAKVADRVTYLDLHRRFAEIGGGLAGNRRPLRLSFRFDGEEIRESVSGGGSGR